MSTKYRGVVCWLLTLTTMTVGQVSAEEAPEKMVSALVDCRYEQRDDGTRQSAFPKDDVFRPLLADPKQPQFFASWQTTRVRTNQTSANIGSVGFGENFGFYTRRNGCNGWQVGVLAGVFAQFNLDAPSKDLINAGYVVGVPFSWRSGGWSTRVRLYHQSSHIGDEFLLGRPGFNLCNFVVSPQWHDVARHAGPPRMEQSKMSEGASRQDSCNEYVSMM